MVLAGSTGATGHKPQPLCVVPRLTGKTLSQARRELSARHCTLGRVGRPAGAGRLTVVAQSPPPGARRPRGTRVAVRLAHPPVTNHASFREYKLPHPSVGPVDMALGPDRNLWFTEWGSPSTTFIGRITPSGQIADFADPNPDVVVGGGAYGEGLAVGPDGKLWTVEYTPEGAAHVARVTPSGVTALFDYGPAQAQGADFRARSLAWGDDGKLWIAESQSIDRFTPGGETASIHLSHNLTPDGITNGPDGNIWFTANQTVDGPVYEYVGRVTPGGAVTLFRLPRQGTEVYKLTLGPDGNLWFTESGAIGRITPTGRITEYKISATNSHPGSIVGGRDGSLWFTDVGTNSIGRITTAGRLSEFRVPTPNSQVTGITTDRRGDVWFAETNTDKIGRLHVG